MEFQERAQTILGELREVFSRIDEESVLRLMAMIDEAPRVFLIGAGREGLATRSLAMRLMHYGKQAHWAWDDTTPGVAPGDLFLITSGSGQIGHIHYVAEEVRRAGARIALVTGSPSGKTAALADHVLFVPASVYKGTDPMVPSIQPMGNLFEQALFLLFDMVTMMLAEGSDTPYAAMAARHRNFE